MPRSFSRRTRSFRAETSIVLPGAIWGALESAHPVFRRRSLQNDVWEVRQTRRQPGAHPVPAGRRVSGTFTVPFWRNWRRRGASGLSSSRRAISTEHHFRGGWGFSDYRVEWGKANSPPQNGEEKRNGSLLSGQRYEAGEAGAGAWRTARALAHAAVRGRLYAKSAPCTRWAAQRYKSAACTWPTERYEGAACTWPTQRYEGAACTWPTQRYCILVQEHAVLRWTQRYERRRVLSGRSGTPTARPVPGGRSGTRARRVVPTRWASAVYAVDETCQWVNESCEFVRINKIEKKQIIKLLADARALACPG